MIVEQLIRDNGCMLAEQETVVISKLIDGPLLLTHLTPLLPDPMLIVQMLQEPDRPLRPFDEHAPCSAKLCVRSVMLICMSHA